MPLKGLVSVHNPRIEILEMTASESLRSLAIDVNRTKARQFASDFLPGANRRCRGGSSPLLSPCRVMGEMTHSSREKLDLVNRTKKIIGQLESVLRGLNEDEHCADVLQRLAAARGAINALMAELMEDHIRNHMPRNSKSSEEAAEDVIEIVRTYLK